MKTLTLSLMSLFIVAGLSARTTDSRLHARLNKSEIAKQEIFTHPSQKGATSQPAKTTFVGRAATVQAELWKPTTGEFFIAEEGEWTPVDATTFEYDQKGNIISDNNGSTRVESKYNANNMLVERLVSELQDDNTWLPSEKKCYQYDDRVTNCIVDQQFSSWNSKTNDWIVTYHHKRNITRNAKGNITEISIEVLYDGKMECIERSEIVYNDRELADSWTQFSLDQATFTSFVEVFKCSNISWQNTDGQLVGGFNDFVMGNNRMKKADISINAAPYGTFNCSYSLIDHLSPDFDYTFASSDLSEVEKRIYTQIDSNGSSKEAVKITIMEDGVESVLSDEYMLVMIDEYKNVISERFFLADGEQIDGLMFTHTYDPDKLGVCTETVTSMFNPETTAYFDTDKTVYSNFINVVILGVNGPSAVQPSYWMQNGMLMVDTEQACSYQVYNSNGQVIIGATAGQGSLQIPTQQLPRGVYTLVVVGNNTNSTIRFVK